MKLAAITREHIATKAWWRPSTYAYAARSNIVPIIADGPSPAIKAILSVLSETEASRAVTQRLVDALQGADAIQPWKLNLLQEGQTVPVEGLYRIDEAALNTLADEVFLSLRKAGALALAYAQLYSKNQLAMLTKAAEVQARVREQMQAKASACGNRWADRLWFP